METCEGSETVKTFQHQIKIKFDWLYETLLWVNFTALVSTRFQCYNKRKPGLDQGCEMGPMSDHFMRGLGSR